MGARLSGLVVGALIVGACGGGAPVHSIVPVPRDFERGSGTVVLDGNTRIGLAEEGDAELRRVAELWAGPIRVATGLPLLVGGSGQIGPGYDGALELGAAEIRDAPRFPYRGLRWHLERLDALGVNYRALDGH